MNNTTLTRKSAMRHATTQTKTTTTTTRIQLRFSTLLLMLIAAFVMPPTAARPQNSLLEQQNDPVAVHKRHLILPHFEIAQISDRDSALDDRERPERDVDEIDSLDVNSEDGEIELASTHRLSKDDVDDTEARSPNAEPLSIQHGNYLYSVDNSTEKRQSALEAFQMLKPERHPQANDENSSMEERTVGQGMPSEQRVASVNKHRKKGKGGRRKDDDFEQPNDVGGQKPLEGRQDVLLRVHNAKSIKKTQVCETQKFKQRVKVPGCLTKVIVNRFCHGTCSSFFIPRMKAKKLKAVFQSCAACTPKEYDSMDVTLDCPGQNPPQVKKSIMMVKKCECRDVDMSNFLEE